MSDIWNSTGHLQPNAVISGYVPPTSGTPVAPVVSPTTVPTITGIDPTELANATYGKVIPIVVGGKARIGGSIIAGPYLNTINDALCATFAVSFGFPADPTGTRVLFEIALDSNLVWKSDSGTATISSGTFIGGSFTARFYQGTYTQSADPIEIEKWGSNAVAYRPQMVIWFQNLPLTNYSNKIPFVAAMIGDTTDGADPDDGINIGEGLERLAYSPWVGMSASNFDTSGITDLAGAMILAEDRSFITLLQEFARVYRSWDILQTDKLKVVDRGASVSPDITLDRTKIINGPVTFARQEPLSVAGELELITIDPDADYMMLPSVANRPREPYRVSGSRGKESVTLPIVVDASTRQALVTYMKFAEEQARRRVSLVATSYALQAEPGDYIQLEDLHTGIDADTFKVVGATHRGDYTVGLELESFLRCRIAAYSSGPPLDGISGVNGAWSWSRKLISSYEGDFTTDVSGETSILHDQTGNGNDLSDGSSAARRPTLATAGPHSVLCGDFDGAANFLTSAVAVSTFMTAAAGYMIVSFRPNTISANSANPYDNEPVMGDTGGFLGIYLKNTTGSPETAQAFNFDSGGSDSADSAAISLNTVYVVEWWHEGGSVFLCINNGTPISVSSGNTLDVTNPLGIGHASSGSARFLDGQIFEAAISSAKPAERADIAINFMQHVGAV